MSQPRPFRDLLERAKRGDRDALDELSRRFYAPLREYVTRRMGERARRWGDSGEIANRALEEVLRNLHRLPTGATRADLTRRLKRTALSRLIDHVRSHRRDGGESGQDLLSDSTKSVVSTLESVTRADIYRWLKGEIDKLAPLYREVVRMRLLDGLSLEEASRALGVSKETARKRFARGCRALKRRLPEREIDANRS